MIYHTPVTYAYNNHQVEHFRPPYVLYNYSSFDFDDYLKDIPKDNEEMMAFVKKCITLYFENPEKRI